MCEPKSVGSLLRQLNPERTFHRLLGPEVATFRRWCDDPSVVGHGVLGGPRTSVPGDPRYGFELLDGRKYILAGQICFELRAKAKRFISVKQLNVLDAGVEARPCFRIHKQRPDCFSRGSDTVRGACRILGRFFSDARPASFALPSELRTQTNRAGLLLAEVGPHFRRSYKSRTTSSPTGVSVQRWCVRARRNIWSSAKADRAFLMCVSRFLSLACVIFLWNTYYRCSQGDIGFTIELV